ncbi:MAG: chemotaxis protein CheB [Acidobacteriota bacterium]
MKIGIAAGTRLGVEALRRAVTEGTRHSVVWVARDGIEAETRCSEERVDLLLLDVDVGGIDAVELTRRIVKAGQAAILLLTPGKDAAVGRIFEAMGLGALDAVAAPTLDTDGALRNEVTFRARLATVEKLIAPSPSTSVAHGPAVAALPPLVAIGASTGGPQALAAILSKLPRDLEAAVVVVQHIDRTFADGLASWLCERTSFPVALARHGDRPEKARALLAHTEHHMVLASDRTLAYTAEPASLVHRPSVDVFFGSLAPLDTPGLAVLLTGMGRDGADGLLRLRRAGWATICQDPREAVVEGMPRAGVELGAAAEVLTLPAIAASIAAFAARAGKRP